MDHRVFVVEVLRRGQWQIVGQYGTWTAAERIRDDYRKRGERSRITTEALATVEHELGGEG